MRATLEYVNQGIFQSKTTVLTLKFISYSANTAEKVHEHEPSRSQQYNEQDFSKWSQEQSFNHFHFERQQSNNFKKESANPTESYNENEEPNSNPVRTRGRNYTPLEKFWYKFNFKQNLANERDAEAANQHLFNRPISRKCQWTFIIVFLVQGLACCCLIPLL